MGDEAIGTHPIVKDDTWNVQGAPGKTTRQEPWADDGLLKGHHNARSSFGRLCSWHMR